MSEIRSSDGRCIDPECDHCAWNEALAMRDNEQRSEDQVLEALARDAAKLEALGQPANHVFWQGREWYGFKPEQCVCGHMLEHPIHAVDLRPFGIDF